MVILNQEEDNELVVTDDVPETSQENEQVETNTSEEVNEVQETTEEVVSSETEDDIETRIEERANQIAEEKMQARVIRERTKMERDYNEKLSKYQELENIMNAGLGTKDVDEAINRASEFYKEQGINIPTVEKKQTLNERDAIILAKADAEDIIKCGEKEMEEEANRIANIPRENRNVRDNTIFNELCKELMARKNIKELKSKGYDTKVLESEDFKNFSSRIVDTPITEVYEMYTKIHNESKVQPKSPGSAKTIAANDEVKEYYSPEEARKFTEEDFIKNPKLEEAVERSMLKWK